MKIKSFMAYLAESEKSYSWRIKIAQDIDNDQCDCIENALQAYDLSSLSKPKSLPIQENPMGFEKLGAVPVYSMTAVVKYPTNESQMTQVLATALRISPAYISVVQEAALTANPGDYMRGDFMAEKSPVLGKDYPANKEGSKQIYGDENISITLKSLDKKTSNQKFAKKETSTGGTLNDLPQGTISPIGSTKTKIPDPRKRIK